MIADKIDFMKEEVCLNFIDSIQQLIPVVSELNERATLTDADNTLLIVRYHGKLKEAARNLESYFNLIISTMEDVVIKNIRASIANTIGVIDKNAALVSMESTFIGTNSYTAKSNTRIKRFNLLHKDEPDIAIEEAFIINPSANEWYDIIVNGDNGIAIKKIPMDAVSPREIIDKKLPDLLDIADQFVIYLERYRNEMMDKYFSTGMIKIIEGMHRGTVNQHEIFGFLPNRVELEKMYSDVMIINATVNAFFSNITTADSIVTTEVITTRTHQSL